MGSSVLPVLLPVLAELRPALARENLAMRRARPGQVPQKLAGVVIALMRAG
jgi:hypothetical protein